MKPAINLNSFRIDGEKLKAAREAKELSVSEIAASLTLSRAQVTQLEEGGEKSFYTFAHKLLATRKYANALGLVYDEVVTSVDAGQTLAAVDGASPAIHSYNQGPQATPSELRLAAVARNAVIRRRTMIAIGALFVLLAIFAKLRGVDDTFIAFHEPKDAPVDTPVASLTNPAQPVSAPLPAVLVATAVEPAVPVQEARQVVTDEPKDSCPPPPVSANLKSWSAVNPRKSDSRVFFVSHKEAFVCIADASGKTASLNLKPKIGQSFSGKPPYLVRSSLLASLEIYIQGLRVKIPSETMAIRLNPTRFTSDNQTPATSPDA